MKSTTHLGFTVLYSIFAFCLSVFIIALGQVEGWDTMPWWIYLCEVILVFISWINYQEFKRKQVIEQNLIP